MKYLRHIEEGTLEEYNLTCPWHDGVFDVRDTTVYCILSDQTPWAAFYLRDCKCPAKVKHRTIIPGNRKWVFLIRLLLATQ